MATLPRKFVPVFADTIEQGDLLAADRRGSQPYVVLTEPELVRNLVGENAYIRARVQIVGTNRIGSMIYPVSRCVYRATTRIEQTPA